MKSITKSRTAAFGMAGALALGTVATVGAITPATAADATYTCGLLSGPAQLPIVGTMALPTTAVAPGASLASLPTTLGVTLPGTLTEALAALLITNVAGSVTDAKFPIGNTGSSLGTTALTESGVPITGGSPAALLGEGVTAAGGVAPMAPGSYDIMMPSEFSFVPVGLPAINCVTASPAVLGTLLVAGDGTPAEKAASTTRAHLKNGPVTKGEHAKIRVKVRTDGEAASGKVIAKQGKRVLKKVTLNDNGNKTVRLPLLSRGRHKIVLKYKGNDTTERSRDVVVFRVRRG